MSDNNGKGWEEKYLSLIGKISGDSSHAEEKMYFGMLVRDIIDATKQYSKHNINKKSQRINHAKIRGGFTDARLIISPSLPSGISAGFLQPSAVYDNVIIRFSNASGSDSKADDKPDLRGVVFRVKYKDCNHDFLMTNAEEHHAVDAREAMVAIMAGVEKDIWENRIPLGTFLDELAGLPALKYLREKLGADTAHRIAHTLRTQMHHPVESLATETYWSRAPIAIGKVPDSQQSVAVKYRLLPTTPKSNNPQKQNDLEKDLLDRVSEGDIKFLFQVQKYIDPEITPIEDATIVWPSIFETVGELIIKKGTALNNEVVNEFEFSPWTIDLQNFLPIGSMNRARQIVYPAAVTVRKKTYPTHDD